MQSITALYVVWQSNAQSWSEITVKKYKSAKITSTAKPPQTVFSYSLKLGSCVLPLIIPGF